MIKYTVNNNTVIAEFSRDWIDTLVEYYFKNTYINYDTLRDIVYDYLLKVENDGLKFYGEAKCSPDDIFEEEIGKQIAKTRLINKYNRVVRRINEILIELIKSDMRFLRTRQRWRGGWHDRADEAWDVCSEPEEHGHCQEASMYKKEG